MGKAAKEHRRKVQARNNKIKQKKDGIQKMQREYIMNMIKQEQEKGMFENTQSINPLDGATIIEGPAI
jgi:hypothetical protein